MRNRTFRPGYPLVNELSNIGRGVCTNEDRQRETDRLILQISARAPFLIDARFDLVADDPAITEASTMQSAATATP